MLKKEKLGFYLPLIFTSIALIIGYFLGILSGKLFHSEPISFWWFAPPILTQLCFILLFIFNQFQYKSFPFVLGNVVWSSFIVQFGAPIEYDSTAFTFGFVVICTLMMTILKIREYLTLHFLIFFLHGLLFFFSSKKIGNDELYAAPIIIGGLLFFPFLNIYIMRVKNHLKKKSKRAEEVTVNLTDLVDKKTKDIQSLVNNLGQGFMVLDKNGVVQEGATQITKDFFKMNPVGKSLSEVLKLDEEKREIFNKWIRNIYRGVLSFRDLRTLGPQSFEEDGLYIDLDYKPIYVEGRKREIDRIICIATNKTQEIELERQLELDKQKAEFINTCLQNPSDFIDLLDNTQELLFDYKEIIKENNFEELFRSFHTLKARWGQFGVKSLTKLINDIESSIEDSFQEKIIALGRFESGH